MIQVLKKETAKHGDKAAIIPVRRLANIRQDVEELRTGEELNNFQRYIQDGIYKFGLPDAGFEIRSIVIVAAPCPSTLSLTFNWQGKRIPVILPASYSGKFKVPKRIENYLNAFFNLAGYHVLHAPQLPHKLIAVRSGLGMYGRNNICYVEGMGSFLNLNPYFSDIPCPEDTWQDIRQMDLCRTCQACLHNCPTAAILPARFLIDNERCLTYFNEAGREWNFPAWIDPSAHHTLYGCLRCQAICPVNKPFVNTADKPVEFTEAESALLIEGQPFELFPEDLKQTVQALEMMEYLGAIPRNFRALFNNAA